MKEANVWKGLRHPSILPFLGVWLYNGHFYLVSPFVVNGAIQQYLAKNPSADRPKFVSTVVSVWYFA